MAEEVLKEKIMLSWEKCSTHGLSSDMQYPKIIVKDKQLKGIISKNKVLIEAFNDSIRAVMENVKRDILVILTDRNAILIEYYCSPDMLNALGKIQFKRGISFREDSCGTNAISLVYEHKKPIYLLPHQHYCKLLKEWYCYASPICVDSEIIGYIDVTTVNRMKGEVKCIIDLLVEIIASKFPHINTEKITSNEYSLDDRHLEIINMISKGMTSEEIGERLCLSVNTIKYHRKTILKAFNAKNSNEVLAKAYSEGIIECLLPRKHSRKYYS